MSNKTETIKSISHKIGELETINKSSNWIADNFGAKAAADYLKFMEVYPNE